MIFETRDCPAHGHAASSIAQAACQISLDIKEAYAIADNMADHCAIFLFQSVESHGAFVGRSSPLQPVCATAVAPAAHRRASRVETFTRACAPLAAMNMGRARRGLAFIFRRLRRSLRYFDNAQTSALCPTIG